MPMDTILREKRKALGLTQEQVANYLGVTTPAVNKWEKGSTCPDLMLLPALARLLKTDPNTLLNFEKELTPLEITQSLNEISEKIRSDGFASGFAQAVQSLQEYPNCTALLHSMALLLDGALLMAQPELPQAQAAEYHAKILELYERVAQSNNPALANQARYMLASNKIAQQEIPLRKSCWTHCHRGMRWINAACRQTCGLSRGERRTRQRSYSARRSPICRKT